MTAKQENWGKEQCYVKLVISKCIFGSAITTIVVSLYVIYLQKIRMPVTMIIMIQVKVLKQHKRIHTEIE